MGLESQREKGEGSSNEHLKVVEKYKLRVQAGEVGKEGKPPVESGNEEVRDHKEI